MTVVKGGGGDGGIDGLPVELHLMRDKYAKRGCGRLVVMVSVVVGVIVAAAANYIIDTFDIGKGPPRLADLIYAKMNRMSSTGPSWRCLKYLRS